MAPPSTIGLLTPYTGGNLGDAAIQEATITAIRTRWPSARILAFTLHPAETERLHGVPSYPLSGYAPPGYTIGGRTARASGLGRVADFLAREPLHVARALRRLRQMDLLLVAGGGQLDDYWGGAWGHPYALWKWTALARLVGTRIAFLSVGLGTLRTPLARRFIRGALGRAGYRSFRDERTAAAITQMLGGGAELVVPDLAFALSSQPAPVSRPEAIGISPIAYQDPRVWPEKDGGRFRAYVERLAEVVARFTAARRPVVLFATDTPDRIVIDDVLAMAGHAPSVRVAHTPTLDALFQTLTGVGTVVASRLHGVILAQVTGHPVVALSYDWKVARHMEEMGQVPYTLPIDTFDAAAVGCAVQRLEQQAGDPDLDVSRRLTNYRILVQDQFARVLA